MGFRNAQLYAYCITTPSVESSKTMPDENTNGSIITSTNGLPAEANTADIESMATSDAVSNPIPNKTPTKNICQLDDISFIIPLK